MKMNKTIAALVTVIAIAAGYSETKAQEYTATPVTISKEKVRVNGKICYSHIVLEKQTLYSIAKAYGVTIEDICRFNPSISKDGLKKNSIILIPSQDALMASAGETGGKTEVRKDTAAVTAAPAGKTEPKDELTARQDKSKKTKLKVHIRKWYEDLDVIAEKYGVTTEALMKANNLTGRKLANRQKLIIPDMEEIAALKEQEAETIPDTEEVTPAADTTVSSETVPEETAPKVFTPKDKVNMTVILPMKASAENSSRNNIDFYSGVLLAARDMAEEGLDIELNVYDSTDPDMPVSKEDLENSDIIIGPVAAGDLKRLLEAVPGTSHVASPLDQRAEYLADLHSNFIQVPSPHKAQYNDLAAWIQEDKAVGDRVLVITEKGERQTEAVRQMCEALDSSGVEYTPFSYSILEGRDVIEPLTGLMTAEGANRVFIASESEAFVNDVVRNLNILVYKKLNVVLYAPAKIRSFETIEVENLHNTSLHVSLTYDIDYDRQDVRAFLMKYRALFNTEPSQFAFQGYDTAMFFAKMCRDYGEDWKTQMDKVELNMLQNTFKYHKTDAGYLNNGTRRMIYGKNWEVKRVR